MRALTRVAGPGNEDELLAFALKTTATRVEERCRELRYGSPASSEEALRAQARCVLSLRRNPQRGTATIMVELPLETAELIDKALDRAMEATTASEPLLAEQSWAEQRADALVAMAKQYLIGNGDGAHGTPDHYQQRSSERCGPGTAAADSRGADVSASSMRIISSTGQPAVRQVSIT